MARRLGQARGDHGRFVVADGGRQRFGGIADADKIARPRQRLVRQHDHAAGKARALGPVAEDVIGRPAIGEHVVAVGMRRRDDPAAGAAGLADHGLDQHILAGGIGGDALRTGLRVGRLRRGKRGIDEQKGRNPPRQRRELSHVRTIARKVENVPRACPQLGVSR